MNRKKTKLLSILLSVTLALSSTGFTVTAAEDVGQPGSIEITNFNDDIISAEGAGADGLDAEADLTMENAEGTTDGMGETVISPEDTLFPGLPESYILSEEQYSQKTLLAEHTDEIAPFVEEDNSALYVKGQLIYMTDSAEDAQMVADAFGSTLDSYELGFALIILPEARTVTQAVMAAAEQSSRLPAVWPNYYKYLYANYNDPALKEGNSVYQWQHEFVGDSYAWAAGYTGKGIKVGIVDSGLQDAHEEFAGRVVKHVSTVGTSTVSSTTDLQGHGTHVAGIVAANGNNGKGGAGIAPNASLYIYGAGAADGTLTTLATNRAINAAIEDHVDVINMSYGSGIFNGSENLVIQKAYTNGIALFAAAGNNATNGKSYPASYSNVCSIASLQQDGKKSSFSNYNDSVDLAFPGSQIYSTYVETDANHKIVPNSKKTNIYAYMDGTSMACPVATGVAAVILSGADQIPALKGKTGKDRVDALYRVMRSNAKKSPSAGTGAGTTYLPSVFNLTVDNAAAVPATPKFDLSNKKPIAAVTTTLSITSDTKVGVSIYYSTNGKKPSFKNGVVTNGTLYTGPITIGNAKKVTVNAIAVNHATGKTSKVASAAYTFAPNPIGVGITAKGDVTNLAPGSSLALKAAVYPSFAVSSKVTWSVTPADQGVTVNKSGKVSVARDAAAGSYTVQATAVDKKNQPYTNAAIGNYSITVIEPASSVKSIVLKNKTASLYTTDELPMNLAEGFTLTYADGSLGTADDVVWSSSNRDIVAVTNKTQNTPAGLVTGKKPGTATITATANDGTGKSASCKVTVKQLATGLKLEGPNKLAAGKSITLKATISPSNVSSKTLNWKVDGTGVTVKNGKISAAKNASGTYTITATTKDGSEDQQKSATHQITIINDMIKSIRVPKTMTLFTTPGNFQAPTEAFLEAEVSGGDSTAITYTSSAPGIASVDPSTGQIQARSSGKAKITCAATDGSNKKAVCTVTVSVPMSRLTIVPADTNGGYVSAGCTLKLKTQAGTSYGKPQSTKVNWFVPDEYKDYFSVNSSGVIKAKDISKYLKDDELYASAYVIAEAADGSNVRTAYSFNIYRKIKSYKLVLQSDGTIDYIFPRVTFDNGVEYCLSCFDVSLSAPKGKDIGMQPINIEDYGKGFYLCPAKQTTFKSSSNKEWFTSDGIKIKLKIKQHAANKTATFSGYVARTSDNHILLLK